MWNAVSSRIWTRGTVSISYDDNHYATGTSILHLIRTLYCWVLSKVVSSTTFKVFGMTQPGIEPRSPGPLADTQSSRPMSRIKLYIHICTLGKISISLFSLSLFTPTTHFLFNSKHFLFYHYIPQRSLVSGVLHGSDLLIYNHLDASSAGRKSLWWPSSILHSRLRILHQNLPAKSRGPTSIG